MTNRKTTTEKIQAERERKQQIDNEIKRLLQQERAEERKKRNHRICKRGGLLEKLLPDTIALTDEQFEQFLKKVMLNDQTRRTLERYTAQGEKAPAYVPAGKAETVSEITGAEQTESEVRTF